MILTSKDQSIPLHRSVFELRIHQKIPRGLALDWTRTSSLRDWRLPSTATERLATSESGHFSNRDVGIGNYWTVWNSNLSVSARDFLFSTAAQYAPGHAQPPVLPLPGVKRSGHEFYCSLHLVLKVSTGRAIVLLLHCVSNGMLRSYLHSLTPEDMSISLIDWANLLLQKRSRTLLFHVCICSKKKKFYTIAQ